MSKYTPKDVEKKADPTTHKYRIAYMTIGADGIPSVGIVLTVIDPLGDRVEVAKVYQHPCGEPVLSIPADCTLCCDTLMDKVLPIMEFFETFLIVADAVDRGWDAKGSDIKAKELL